MTRHIGKTTYKVRVHLSETANETMEDKILRLIRNDGLAMDGECGIMEDVYKRQALNDTDMKYLLLYLEETYGLTNEKKIDNAIGIVANERCV